MTSVAARCLLQESPASPVAWPELRPGGRTDNLSPALVEHARARVST